MKFDMSNSYERLGCGLIYLKNENTFQNVEAEHIASTHDWIIEDATDYESIFDWDDGYDSLDSQYLADRALDYERDKQVAIWAVSKPVQYESIMNEMIQLFGSKSPISMLMEYMQYSKLRVNFIEVIPHEGPDHKPIFTIVAAVDGQPYTRVQGRTKKDSRTGAAYMAWKTIIFEEQDKLRNFMNMDLPMEDYIASKVYMEYLTQVLKNPMVFCGRKILSSIVMVDRDKVDNDAKYTVTSLATGNRCIASQHLSLDGLSVNDSHAEIITRRAFLRFLHNEVMKHKSDEDTIFVTRSTNGGMMLEVKENIEFHLYISVLPCGDASVFSKEKFRNNDPNRSLITYDENAESPIFDSAVQGLLRSKIEAGEGAIPAERAHLQSWVGLMFGNRLRTMCCSDKILKWNAVGLQGALLSQILKPIYLSSVVVGENFIRGHVTRALYHRLARKEIISRILTSECPEQTSTEDSVPRLDLHHPYRLASPSIVKSNFVNLFEQQETEKSSALAVVWYHGLDRAEVFDGTTGKFQNETIDSTEHPCICKKSIFDSFKKVTNWPNNSHNNDKSDDDISVDDNNNLPTTCSYYRCKQQVRHYQEAKRVFFVHMELQGLGGWITKPIEIDFFH